MAFVIVALLWHAGAGVVLVLVLPHLMPNVGDRGPKQLRVVRVEAPPENAEKDLEDPPEPDVTGQIVEVSPPEEEIAPEDAEYLAEYEQTVDEETRVDRFKVNPEVLARVFSQDEKMEQEDLLDMNVEKPSTGAQVGNHRFDPDRDGSLAALPSPWTQTNKDGPQDPVPASHTAASVAGAPSNDLLREDIGDALNLNTKEFLYAGYLNRIRRLVNFYWQQNLDNLPRSVRLAKPRYTTEVHSILNADGALEFIEVVAHSGSGELDDAVVRAFRLAGPFPNPPEGLIEKDGRVYLPEMDFTVQIGAARAQYQGIDPRAGVQYPGILKSPR
jgi:hypothetical protein